MESHPEGKNRKNYTKGQLNGIVDSLLHPLFSAHPELVAFDTVLHALVEQDPSQSAQKFVRYNLPKIIKILAYGQNDGPRLKSSKRRRRDH